MAHETDSLFQIALSAIDKYLDRSLFKDAADSVVLAIRGFEDEETLFSFLSKKIDALSDKDFDKFMGQLTQRIKFSKMVTEKFVEYEAKDRLDRFIASLTNYLEEKARFYHEHNKRGFHF